MANPAELQSLRWTKLNRPRITRDVVRRDRVWERLGRGLDHPLTLVCAPAGYGKTTLLSTWLANCGQPYAWLSLDESDNDLTSFLSYFVAAIRTAYPEACARILRLLSAPELPPAGLLATALANDLAALPGEPGSPEQTCLVLVLDDYHFVRNEAIHTLLAETWRHPPRTVHLILSTRQDPPLPLDVLRARGELSEIRMQELRFTREEVAVFVQQATELPLEVLSHVPAATQNFLLTTSILDRLSGPLCATI